MIYHKRWPHKTGGCLNKVYKHVLWSLWLWNSETSRLEVELMCLSKAACLYVDCCSSELAQWKCSLVCWSSTKQTLSSDQNVYCSSQDRLKQFLWQSWHMHSSSFIIPPCKARIVSLIQYLTVTNRFSYTISDCPHVECFEEDFHKVAVDLSNRRSP
jgi:hypothetical protein